MTRHSLMACAIGAALFAGIATSWSQSADHRMILPADLKWADVVILQPKTPHFAWTREETVVQVHGTGSLGITCVNPADDPRAK